MNASKLSFSVKRLKLLHTCNTAERIKARTDGTQVWLPSASTVSALPQWPRRVDTSNNKQSCVSDHMMVGWQSHQFAKSDLIIIVLLPSNQKIFVATRTDFLCAQDTHVHISCGSVGQSGRISCVIARRSQTASSSSIFPSAHHGLSVQRWSHMWHQHEIRGKPPQCRPRTFEANHSKLCVQFCFSSKPSKVLRRYSTTLPEGGCPPPVPLLWIPTSQT